VQRPDTSFTTITPTETQTYVLTFTHPDGCTAQDSIAVKVIDPETLDCDKIFLPNAFTPYNTQGRNDRFGISNPFAVRDFISFEVFDRWGGKVFAGTDRFDSWDGQYNGQPVNPGMYLYRLRYSCDGTERVKSGNLMLLK
jgi:gliding motility-associated-like protein